MARRIKPIANVVVGTWPVVLWKTCHKCAYQFRREWGWKFHRGMETHYICSTCAETIEEANSYVRNYG